MAFRLPRFLRASDPMDFPPEWRPIVAAAVAQWPYLSPLDRVRLEALVWAIVEGKRWEAAQGFELTDEIQVTIGALAALLVLGLDLDIGDVYGNVPVIIVHASTVHLTGPRPGNVRGTESSDILPILGLAQHNGPIVIAWDEAERNARHPERGHNVVYHEFAHKLDMLDGMSDGTPPLETQAALDRWVAVCTAEYELLRDGTDDGFL